MAVSIRCENLCKSFGATRALDGITLTVEPGELFFLLGPSGCGKTTLLRCVAGFCPPDKGRVFIGERDVTDLPPHRRDTGMVFQSYALWPHMTVRENVAFGLQMRKVPRHEAERRVTEALSMVRIADRADARPAQLSGGQQQRVALARALVIHPSCLLLDEPLSNLDAKLRLEMRTEIRRICKEADLTAIYVTHDQKEALSIADRIAIINEGRVIQIGEPQEVYLRPCNVFAAGFIGETNFVRGAIVEMAPSFVRVQTPIGLLTSTVRPAGTLKVGQQVTISIRPEALRIVDQMAPPATPNRLDGSVHHTVYLGEVAQHQLTFPVRENTGRENEVTFKAFEMNPRIVARDSVQPVMVWIATEDVVILTE
ncbi:MAG: ABC transporter ATP-binding protein [Kiritimatiellae bacterium]|nr:ABC transporter ATP-binding protein [Kiritimatiellia bacterium]